MPMLSRKTFATNFLNPELWIQNINVTSIIFKKLYNIMATLFEHNNNCNIHSRVLMGELTFWRYSQACKKRPSCENPIYSKPVIYRLEQNYLASFTLIW